MGSSVATFARAAGSRLSTQGAAGTTEGSTAGVTIGGTSSTVNTDAVVESSEGGVSANTGNAEDIYISLGENDDRDEDIASRPRSFTEGTVYEDMDDDPITVTEKTVAGDTTNDVSSSGTDTHPADSVPGNEPTTPSDETNASVGNNADVVADQSSGGINSGGNSAQADVNAGANDTNGGNNDASAKTSRKRANTGKPAKWTAKAPDPNEHTRIEMSVIRTLNRINGNKTFATGDDDSFQGPLKDQKTAYTKAGNNDAANNLTINDMKPPKNTLKQNFNLLKGALGLRSKTISFGSTPHIEDLEDEDILDPDGGLNNEQSSTNTTVQQKVSSETENHSPVVPASTNSPQLAPEGEKWVPTPMSERRYYYNSEKDDYVLPAPGKPGSGWTLVKVNADNPSSAYYDEPFDNSQEVFAAPTTPAKPGYEWKHYREVEKSIRHRDGSTSFYPSTDPRSGWQQVPINNPTEQIVKSTPVAEPTEPVSNLPVVTPKEEGFNPANVVSNHLYYKHGIGDPYLYDGNLTPEIQKELDAMNAEARAANPRTVADRNLNTTREHAAKEANKVLEKEPFGSRKR